MFFKYKILIAALVLAIIFIMCLRKVTNKFPIGGKFQNLNDSDDQGLTMKNDMLKWDYIKLKRQHYKSQEASRNETIVRSYTDLKSALHVQVDCPGLLSIGGVLDGSKDVCSPWDLPKNCIIYSLGLSSEVYFETEIMDLSNPVNSDAQPLLITKSCSIFGFDPTYKPALYEKIPRAQGYPYKISPNTSIPQDEYSIVDLMTKFGHKFIDILKIDIESDEHSTILPLVETTVTPQFNNLACQLLIEVHHAKPVYLRKLEQAGFLLFSKRENVLCRPCMELSYIHCTCLSQYHVSQKYLSNFGY